MKTKIAFEKKLRRQASQSILVFLNAHDLSWSRCLCCLSIRNTGESYSCPMRSSVVYAVGPRHVFACIRNRCNLGMVQLILVLEDPTDSFLLCLVALTDSNSYCPDACANLKTTCMDRIIETVLMTDIIWLRFDLPLVWRSLECA